MLLKLHSRTLSYMWGVWACVPLRLRAVRPLTVGVPGAAGHVPGCNAVVPWAQGSAAQASRPGGSHGPPGNPQTRGPLGSRPSLALCGVRIVSSLHTVFE